MTTQNRSPDRGRPAGAERPGIVNNRSDSEASRTVAPQIFCRSCASPLVQAADWDREDRTRWIVRLWCPECGFEQMALLDHPQVIYLSLAVEEGFACMLEALAEFETLGGSGFVGDNATDLDLIKRARVERIEPTGL
jgi:hypothetical protein